MRGGCLPQNLLPHRMRGSSGSLLGSVGCQADIRLALRFSFFCKLRHRQYGGSPGSFAEAFSLLFPELVHSLRQGSLPIQTRLQLKIWINHYRWSFHLCLKSHPVALQEDRQYCYQRTVPRSCRLPPHQHSSHPLHTCLL